MNTLTGIAIRAVTAAVPTQVARTQDYEHLSPEDRQRFQKATGIGQRRISPDNQYVSDLCAAAGKRVMEHLKWEEQSVGALILVTQTADQPIPATSIVLQDRLGLPQTCAAFDINLGCSAFPYGLAIAGSLMKNLGISRGLLLMGDISSRVCARHDKSAWPLFGDAGSAIALELDEGAVPMHVDLMSDGSGKGAIIVPSGGLASRIPPPADVPVPSEVGPDGISRRPDNLILRGADIFSFAISKVPPSINRVIKASGKEGGDFDFLVLHQANKMINDTIARKTGFEPERALSSLKDFGNTSSASIPVTLCANADVFGQERHIIACGFGVGLSWASISLAIPAQAVLPMVETDDAY